MEKEVLKTINKFALIEKGDTVIVGLSGGADSVSLLICLNNLKETLGIKKLIAVHLNHMLRDTAERDEEFSSLLCKKLNIDFYKKKVDIKALKKSLKVCEEDAGRIARYEFFNEIREKTGADKIATAHNKNDQTETFLMRILRGSGTDGLSGIKPIREDNVIRPLININREEILKYLKDNSQDYVTDETNLKPDYLRNKIRLELIPYLKEEFALKDDVISNITNALREDSYYLNALANEHLNRAKRKDKAIVFDLCVIRELPDALLKRIINLSVNTLSQTSVLKNNIENTISVIKNGLTGKKADLSKNVEAAVEYDKFIIRYKGIINKYFYNLKIGVTYIKEAGLTVTVKEGEEWEENSINIPDFSSLVIRTRENGDKMFVENVGHKKIKDIFIDKKIPREKREKIPVVCLDNEIIWLYGIYKRKLSNNKYNVKIEWR